MTKDFLNSLALFLAVLIFALGAVLATIAWTEPTSAPPAGNIPAPINVGSQAQTKEGPLTIKAVLDVKSEVYGQIFRDQDEPNYYVNPASPGIAGTFLGNVGIGTTAPEAKLEINSNISGPGGWLKGIHFTPTSHSAITLKNPDPGKGGLLFGLHGINQKFYFGHYNTDDTWDKYVMVIDALSGNILAPFNLHDNCYWTSWTCADQQTCNSGYFMAGVERGANSGAALCGTAPRQWYQMRIYCCQI